MICTSCGTTNRDVAQFCRGCGTALMSPPPQPSPGSPLSTDVPPTSYPGYQSQYPPSQANPLYNPGYGSYQAPMPAGASGKATASLILSIISIFASPCLMFMVPASFLLSVAGMILGKLEMTAISEGRSPAAGLSYAKAGFWIGLIMTALSCLGFSLLMGLGLMSSLFQHL